MTIARGEPLLASDINNLTFFPKGMILMFDGDGWVDNQTIIGWYACTAANKAKNLTPDLENSFIKGSATTTHAAGGNIGNEVLIGANHLPTHTHGLSGISTGGMSTNATGKCVIGPPKGDNGGGASSEGCLSARISGTSEHGNFNNGSGGYEISINVSHTHSFPSGTSTGNNSTTAAKLNIEPQSYKLIYIRKCA
jgi:hypothetical protein